MPIAFTPCSIFGTKFVGPWAEEVCNPILISAGKSFTPNMYHSQDNVMQIEENQWFYFLFYDETDEHDKYSSTLLMGQIYTEY